MFRIPTCTLLAAALLGLSLAPAATAEEPAARGLSIHDQADLLAVKMKSKDSEERLQAAKDALKNPHESLTSPLLKLIADKHDLVRQAALQALGVRTDKKGRKRAATAIAPRLARMEGKSGNRDELLIALKALHDLAQPGPVKGLIGGIKNDSDIDVVEARLFAVANVPSKEAIDRLIQFLGKGRRGGMRKQRTVAAKALAYATGAARKGLGQDPDKWRAWWRESEKTFDLDAAYAAREAARNAADEPKKKGKKKRKGKNKNKNK